MNKKISFPIAVIIIVLCAVLVGVIVVWQYLEILEERFEITGIKKPEETGEEIAKLNIPGNWYYAGGDTLEGYLIFRSDGILELPQGWFPEEENSPRWRYDAERELLIVSFNLTPNLFPEDEAIAKDFFGNIDYPWVGRFVDYNREDLSVSIRVSSETEAIEFFGWLFYKVKDETADWEVYRNEAYGFEIKYSVDWQPKVADWLDPTACAKFSIYLYPPEVDLFNIDARDPVITIGVIESTGESSLPLALFGEHGESMVCENIQVGNFNFCKLTIKQSDISSTDITIYAIDKDSLIYTIAISCGWPECGTRPEFEVFQKILSTFNFL